MTLKELAEYKKNLDELREYRAIGLTPLHMRLALEGAQKAMKELSLFHQYGIWPDNVHEFIRENTDPAPLPADLYTNDSRCIICGAEISAQGSWECWDCHQKGKGYV